MRCFILTIWASELPDRAEVQRYCTGSGIERVRTRGAKMIEFVIAERREFVGVAVFRISNVPLKRLNKRAINIADSHGGDSSVWYYRIDATGAVLAGHGRRKVGWDDRWESSRLVWSMGCNEEHR